jgi:predicted RNase H-like HicB family nuclease
LIRVPRNFTQDDALRILPPNEVSLAYYLNMTLRALIHSTEDGGYWAEVPALPGCVSQGETMDELRSNIREAIEAWLLAATP